MYPDPWVSVAQVAAHIGVSQEIIYRWIKERNMPAHRIGKFWKFRITEVDEWILTGDKANHKQMKHEEQDQIQ
jgi:excisionase family DNA binding protein